MAPRPSNKRAAISTEDVPVAEGSRKKTRFVEPSEDPANFAEEVDAQLENPSARRKGRVNTEGYDSDSSDDGEGVVNSRKPGAAAAEEEEDDMFAVGEKEAKEAAEGTGKKKKEEYLRLGDIEGQEFGDQDDEDEEDENAGMGYKVSKFNMQEEMEEGKFSADGMYVRSFDPHAVHDRWLDGLDEKEMKKARKVHKAQVRLQEEKERAEERELQQMGGKVEVEQQLLAMLKKGETVLEALQRIGARAKRDGAAKKRANNPKTKRAHDEAAMDVDRQAKTAPSDVEQLTHLATTLMSLGDADIYSKTYEEFVRSVRASGKVAQDWVPPSADVQYEYRWAVPEAGTPEEIFGPFGEEDMHAWYNAQYFGVAGEKVQVRKVGASWGSWDDVVL